MISSHTLKMLLSVSKAIINQEAKALLLLSKILDHNYTKALKALIKAKGYTFISGVGKSGHIARKIASTMTSTGSPAFFIHPTEASHGDLGLFKKEDILIMLSNSGKSIELLNLLQFTNEKKIPSVLISSNPASKLSKLSTYNILIPKLDEAGKNKIAPTTSTTMMLALGDAVALSISQAKGFKKINFGSFHPGGNIGSKFLKVESIMHSSKNIPLASEDTNMKEIIINITKKSFGCMGILNKKKKLCGIITDGDLRRNMHSDLLNKKAKEIMSKNPKVILKNDYVVDALKIINNFKITTLFVVEKKLNKIPIGIIHLHDCLRAEK